MKIENYETLKPGFLQGHEKQQGIHLKQRLKPGTRISPEMYLTVSQSHPAHQFLSEEGKAAILRMSDFSLRLMKNFTNERSERMAYFYCTKRASEKCRVSAKALCKDQDNKEFLLVTLTGTHLEVCKESRKHRDWSGQSSSCDQCEYKARNKSRLFRHNETVHSLVVKECDCCEYKTKSRYALKQHMKSKHINPSQSCPQCDYTTTKSEHLKIHMESIHLGIRYPCDQCDFKSTQRAHLKSHKENIHLGVRYFCDQCPYSAGQKAHLATHKNIKHLGIFYYCDLCDFKNGYKKILRQT